MSSLVEMIPTKINGKYDIILPKHRAERPEWFTEAGWERVRLDSMHEHIGEEDVLFYVGSEESEMPALCQMWGAKVVLIEPNPKVWPNAKAIWEANNLDMPMACIEAFASNKTTADHSKSIYINEWMPHAHEEVVGDHGFKELDKESNTYPQVRLSEISGYGGIEYPSAISIDVEGSEWRVLEGLESILKSPVKPKIWLSIHPEFMFRIYGEYQYDLRKWIKDLGYKETILDYQHELHLFYEAA